MRAPSVVAGRRLSISFSHWPSDAPAQPGASSLAALEALPISLCLFPPWLFLASQPTGLRPQGLQSTRSCPVAPHCHAWLRPVLGAPDTACATLAGPGAGHGQGDQNTFPALEELTV